MPFDTRGLHLHSCQVGTSRFRPHRALLMRLGKLLKAAGAHVDVERACPELYSLSPSPPARHPQGNAVQSQQLREAILDVVAIFSGATQHYKIDVTVRSAFQETCSNSNMVPASAASLGEQAKLTRYGPTVLPLSFETLGRLGYKSMEALDLLRSDAALWGKSQFSALGSACDWRRHLEVVLLYEVADAALLCLGRQPQLFMSVG